MGFEVPLPLFQAKKKEKKKKDYLAHSWSKPCWMSHTSSSTSNHYSHLTGVVITQQSWINKRIKISIFECLREQRSSLYSKTKMFFINHMKAHSSPPKSTWSSKVILSPNGSHGSCVYMFDVIFLNWKQRAPVGNHIFFLRESIYMLITSFW